MPAINMDGGLHGLRGNGLMKEGVLLIRRGSLQLIHDYGGLDITNAGGHSRTDT
jgi:hypothetical protein